MKNTPLYAYAEMVVEMDGRLGNAHNLTVALREVDEDNALIDAAAAVEHGTYVMLRAVLDEWHDQARDEGVDIPSPRNENVEVGLCYTMVKGEMTLPAAARS